ncbi:MAG: GNAT family N-acetyltransferase, partial [Saprospiraceae bacterium]|nr:GNAT family N-acetyltransferase [Saprospiraceae bacterium]
MQIQKLNKKTLTEYIHSDKFYQSDVIPISVQRAKSQIANPLVKPDDIMLLLAYEKNDLIGYLGVLPDDIYDNTGLKIHCGWMSCLWVDPGHRGKKIAQQLIEQCFDAWNGHILLTEFTTSAGALYHKMGIFSPFCTLEGRRWYIRSELANILPRKKEVFKYLWLLFKIGDIMINASTDVIKLFRHQKLKGYRLEYVDETDDEINHLVEKTITKQTFRRD